MQTMAKPMGSAPGKFRLSKAFCHQIFIIFAHIEFHYVTFGIRFSWRNSFLSFINNFPINFADVAQAQTHCVRARRA